MLELFIEGQVYEVLLVTKSNVTPVGVVRRGERLFFKLFGGRSAEDIKDYPFAAVQVTNDAELLARLGLNLGVRLEFEERGKYRWIRGLPGVYGRVSFRESIHEDELGKSPVLECSLTPEGTVSGKLPPKPLSRTDFLLIEMAIDLTRLAVAVERGKFSVAQRLKGRIEEHYKLYTRLGGRSETAEAILQRTRLLTEGRFTDRKESL